MSLYKIGLATRGILFDAPGQITRAPQNLADDIGAASISDGLHSHGCTCIVFGLALDAADFPLHGRCVILLGEDDLLLLSAARSE
jgi:hypothetical protein